MDSFKEILDSVPHKTPFRFIDKINSVSEESIEGEYRIKKGESFLEGHFPGNPIVPGVILIEIMAQIGLFALGIYIEKVIAEDENFKNNSFYFTSSDVRFKKACYPEDLVIVTSKKIYFKHQKLKCSIQARNLNGETFCSGVLSGIIV